MLLRLTIPISNIPCKHLVVRLYITNNVWLPLMLTIPALFLYFCVCLLHVHEDELSPSSESSIAGYSSVSIESPSIPPTTTPHPPCMCNTLCVCNTCIHEFIFPPSNSTYCWCCWSCCWSCFYWFHHCHCGSHHCVPANCRCLQKKKKFTW